MFLPTFHQIFAMSQYIWIDSEARIVTSLGSAGKFIRCVSVYLYFSPFHLHVYSDIFYYLFLAIVLFYFISVFAFNQMVLFPHCFSFIGNDSVSFASVQACKITRVSYTSYVFYTASLFCLTNIVGRCLSARLSYELRSYDKPTGHPARQKSGGK